MIFTLSPSRPSVAFRGPPLVGAVKDASLPPPLRLPAILLARTIITADAAALTASLLARSDSPLPSDALASLPLPAAFFPLSDLDSRTDTRSSPHSLTDALSCSSDDLSLAQLNRVASLAAASLDSWRCAPALWVDLLEGCSSSLQLQVLPPALPRAALWALSHLTIAASAAPQEAKLGGSSSSGGGSAAVTAALQWRLVPGAGSANSAAAASASSAGAGASSVSLCGDPQQQSHCVNAVAVASHSLDLLTVMRR